MYDHHAIMKDRLTDNYDKSRDSNISKMLQVMSEEANKSEQSYALMKYLSDIDTATGEALDAKGVNVGLPRGGRVDEDYRRLIKVKTIANLSNGDIPTMNKVLAAFMGGSFIGIEDGFKHTGEYATLFVKVANDTKIIPRDLVEDIKAAGVQVYYMAGAEQSIINIQFNGYSFDVPYKITNTFYTDAVKGAKIALEMALKTKAYNLNVNHPITNVLMVEGEIQADLTVLRTSVMGNATHGVKVYKRTGKTVAGEGRI